ncbi:MAG TPA: hypothetical protein VFZ64_00950 [Nocardioidaceae bacterium]
MTDTPMPRKAVILLVLATGLGALTALLVSGFLTEYGTTSGSWAEGALDGLRSGAVSVVLVGILAGTAFALAGPSMRGRRLAPAVVLGTVLALLAGGAQAAMAKYDTLPVVPSCDAQEFAPPIEEMLTRVEEAFAELDHPDRFGGGGSTGVDGCETGLLNVTYAEAASHYRDELRRAGWTIGRDEATLLQARRGDLVFTLRATRWGEVVEGIRPTRAMSDALLADLP